MSNPAARVLGVHIAAGVAHLALVECPDIPLLDETSKLVPSSHLADAAQLRDFSLRFTQELRRVRAETVAVAYTRLYGGWTYADAFKRVSLEAAIMLGVEEQGFRYISMPQEKAAKAVGVPVTRVPTALAESLGLSTKPVSWKERSVALMVALAGAAELTG